MLMISTDERKQLRKALTSGFRQYSSLKLFVSDNFEELRLDEIAESKATKVASDNLIEYFEEQGDLSTLILALNQARPRNPDVQSLIGHLQDFLQQQLVLNPQTVSATEFSFELPDFDPAFSNDIQLESFLPRQLSYEADVGQLSRGLKLADAVCKISFTDCGTTGTGVLIAPDLVLTNYHVLSRQPVDLAALAKSARSIQFEFGFVSEEREIPVAPECFTVLETSQPIVACSPPEKLDYALLRVEPKIAQSRYQPVVIKPQVTMLKKKDSLNLLQHPEGNVMQISLSNSGVVQTQGSRVWYVNRTSGGSSGSPCFNEDWELVALHHALISRSFGSIREGILLTAIAAEIAEFLP